MAEFEDKRYAIPKDVEEHNIRYRALIELRDHYTKLPFCYKKAVKASISATKENSIFWRKVRNLYPELVGFTVTYDHSQQVVFVKEEAI